MSGAASDSAQIGRLIRLCVVFALDFVLILFLGFVAWRIVHTPRPPLSAEQNAFTRLAWVGRSGIVLESVDLPGHYVMPSVSKQRSSILLTRVMPGSVQICELLTGRKIKARFRDSFLSGFGVWSTDSGKFAFSTWAETRGEIFEATAAGISRRRLFRDDDASAIPEDWSSDGRWLVFTARKADESKLWILENRNCKAHILLKSTAKVLEGRLSRDRKWIALTLIQAGSEDVYAAPLDLTAASPAIEQKALIHISPNGGNSPQWGANSGELFYVDSGRNLITSSLHGPPRKLFSFDSVGGPNFSYRFDGYCPDSKQDAFLVILSRVAE